ncbi:AMP-binding protein [Rummeliibacillus pycnus]|uniref:AMP-binding protein n=1 Tax=Rummeliibacillus pycnus TaxID=101070 RepID=UPI003D281CB2
MQIIESILHHAMTHPNKVALSDGHTQQTYSQLIRKMKKVAYGLHQIGCSNDRIAILSKNRMEFVEVFLGIMYAGCIPVPLDPKWSSNEVKMVIDKCKPKVIFSEIDYIVKNTHDFHICSDNLYTFSNNEEGSYSKWLLNLKELPKYKTNDVLFIAFTSGTTGIPKGYLRTPLSWIKSFEATNEAFNFSKFEDIAAPGPFVQSLSLFALMQSLYCGATFHLFTHFDAKEVINRCEKTPDMILFVVPTMIEKLLETVTKPLQIQALISSGAKWNDESKGKAKEIFGETKLFEFYGSSEASYISYFDINCDDKKGSVGKPFPGVNISIRNNNFQEVPQGEIGQLYIQSDLMFTGYFDMPNETKNVFDNGWLKLGDYVYKDEDGYLYIVGRAKNMIISGGLNIYPEEVELILKAIPEIEEVMVLGIQDSYWGEKVISLVQWKDSQSLTEEEIRTFAEKYLPSYKLPKEILIVEQFIYTSSGKIARQKMKDYLKKVMSCEMPSL